MAAGKIIFPFGYYSPHMVSHLPSENISSLKRLKESLVLEPPAVWMQAELFRHRFVGGKNVPNGFDLSLGRTLIEDVLNWWNDIVLFPPLGNEADTTMDGVSVMILSEAVFIPLRNNLVISIFGNCDAKTFSCPSVND